MSSGIGVGLSQTLWRFLGRLQHQLEEKGESLSETKRGYIHIEGNDNFDDAEAECETQALNEQIGNGQCKEFSIATPCRSRTSSRGTLVGMLADDEAHYSPSTNYSTGDWGEDGSRDDVRQASSAQLNTKTHSDCKNYGTRKGPNKTNHNANRNKILNPGLLRSDAFLLLVCAWVVILILITGHLCIVYSTAHN
jgi:hypothetical protein